MQALLATGTRLRKAQERALAGGGADALQAAQAEERQSVRDLTQRAAAILEEAGRPATRTVLERIRATLGAAVLTDPERAALKAGRLTTEVQVSGFDALAGIRPAPKGAPTDSSRCAANGKPNWRRSASAWRSAPATWPTRRTRPRKPPSGPRKRPRTPGRLQTIAARAADLAADELAEFERSPA